MDLLGEYAAAPGDPPGLIIGSYSVSLSASLRARDVSRDSQSLGADIPVVYMTAQRSITYQLVLLDLPFRPQFRYKLRLYETNGYPMPVRVRAIDMVSEEVLVEYTTTLSLPSGRRAPAYAEIDLFSETLIALQVNRRARIEITRQDGLDLNWLWAFITITNNETHEITTATPQFKP
jgi:hypothetical protein